MPSKVANPTSKGLGVKRNSVSKSSLPQGLSNKAQPAVKPLMGRNQNKPSGQGGQSWKKVSLAGKSPQNARSPKPATTQPKSPYNDRSQRKSNLECRELQKRSFISEQEVAAMLEGLQMDRNNNVRDSQESLNTAGTACLVNIAKVYAAQQKAFDNLDGECRIGCIE